MITSAPGNHFGGRSASARSSICRYFDSFDAFAAFQLNHSPPTDLQGLGLEHGLLASFSSGICSIDSVRAGGTEPRGHSGSLLLLPIPCSAVWDVRTVGTVGTVGTSWGTIVAKDVLPHFGISGQVLRALVTGRRCE